VMIQDLDVIFLFLTLGINLKDKIERTKLRVNSV